MPERLMQKFEDGRDLDGNDLRQLLRRGIKIDQARITQACIHGFRFLADLTVASGHWQVIPTGGNTRCGIG